MENLSYVPRINQLDAETLDEEFLSDFNEQISNAFRLFLRNPLDTIRPELESVLRFVLWRSTLLKHHSSVGQNLLGIKFSSDQPWRLRALAVLDIISHYGQQRSDLLLRVLPGSEGRKYWVARLMRILSGCLKLLNSLWFLRQGLYPSLALMLLNLKPVSTVTESRAIGYSYMSRELLWSTYRELLMFLVPLLSGSKIKSLLFTKLNNLLGVAGDHRDGKGSSSWVCVSCHNPPVLPCRADCGHLYCYYCSSNIAK